MELKKLLEEKLREAACFGDFETIKELILQGVDINSKNDINGWTPLHWAACRNNIEIVSFLLCNGASKTSMTKKGDLPSDLSSCEKIKCMLGGTMANKRHTSLPIIPNYLKNPSLPCSYMNLDSLSSKRFTNNSEEVLILKVRQLHSSESDFVEIELPKSKLSFERLKHVCCEEFNIKPSALYKIRKLPNTIIRCDKDVQRLQDFQELEIV